MSAATPTSHLSDLDACSDARDWVKVGKFNSLDAPWDGRDAARDAAGAEVTAQCVTIIRKYFPTLPTS